MIKIQKTTFVMTLNMNKIHKLTSSDFYFNAEKL